MVGLARASSIRHALLPTPSSLPKLVSTSCIAAAQLRNHSTNSEHVQDAHENELPRPAHQVSDSPRTRRIQPFPVAAIYPVFMREEDSLSMNSETQGQTKLYSRVPNWKPLSSAIAHSKNIYDLLELINFKVLSHVDGHLLLSLSEQLIIGLRNAPSTPAEFAAFEIIFARLRYLRVEPNKALLITGLKYAARVGSFEALARYLTLLASHGHQIDAEQLRKLLWNLHDYLQKYTSETDQSWHSRRRKQQLLRILTGWQSGGVGRPKKERQLCLFMAISQHNVSYWDSYASLLRKVGGKDVVFGEWLSFKKSLPDHTVSVKDANDTARSAGTTNVAEIACCFARSLIMADDVERAWQVIEDPDSELGAQDSGSELGAISDRIWSMLLDHPQYITKWQPKMAEKVLKKYEEYIAQIEAAMHIRWVGGEDGYHVASIQEEMTEELGVIRRSSGKDWIVWRCTQWPFGRSRKYNQTVARKSQKR